MRHLPFVVCILMGVLMASGCTAAVGDTATADVTADADVTAAADVAAEGESSPNTSSATEVTLQILDLDQTQALVAGHRGKVVIVDGWSTFCPECIEQFPKLVELHRKYPGDVACVSLSFDYEGFGTPERQVERVLRFLHGQQAAFDNVLSSEESLEAFKKLGIASIPAVWVYGRDGVLAQRFPADGGGPFTYDDVAKLVDRLVAIHPMEGETAARRPAAGEQPAAGD